MTLCPRAAILCKLCSGQDVMLGPAGRQQQGQLWRMQCRGTWHREKLLHGRATQRRECTGSEPDPRWAAGHSPAAAQLRPAGPPSQSGQQPLRLLPVSCLRPGTSGRPASQGTGSPQQLCATWQLSWLGQSTSKPCKLCQAGNTLQSNTHPQPLQDCLIRCVSICLNCAQGNASIAPTPAALLTQC